MPGPAAPPIDTPPDLILVEAEGLMAARFDDDAIRLLDRIGPDAPEFTRAQLLSAIAQWNLGQFEDARLAISAIVEEAPTDPEAVRASTWMRMAMMRGDDARDAAREWAGLATGDGSADPWAAMALGRTRVPRRQGKKLVYENIGEGAGEIRDAAVAVARYAPAGAALLRGHAGLLESRWEQAATEYAKVVREAPDQAQAHVDRAFALSQANRHPEAVQEAFDAIQAAPDVPWLKAVLRRTVDDARATPRRMAVALTLFATLLAGRSPGTPAFVVGAVAAVGAILAIGWLVVQIWRTPREIRAVYARADGRTSPLVAHIFQGLLIAFAAFILIFGGFELVEDFPDDPLRTIVAFGGLALTGYEAAKFERKRRNEVPGAWVDLSYPWHRPRYPAVVPAEG